MIVYASGVTEVGGLVSAQNGVGGVGGFIETSGLIGLRVSHAPLIGDGGTWLLDPRNITISNGTTTGSTNVTGTFTANADDAVINQADINTALGTGDVIIATSGGGGTQAGTVTWLAGADMLYNFGSGFFRTLTINADSTITINANIGHINAGTDALNVVLNSAAGVVVIAGIIDTHGGAFTSSGAGFSLPGSISTAGGAATLHHTGAVNLGGALNAGSGDVAITGTTVSQSAVITGNNLTVVASGAVNLSLANVVNHFAFTETGAGAGVTFASASDVTVGSAGSLASSSLNGGDLSVSSPGTLSVNAGISSGGGGVSSLSATTST